MHEKQDGPRLRAEHRPFDLESLPSPAEAQRRFLAAAPPYQPPLEYVFLREAAGRVLAADIIAGEDVPPFHRSTVDGYAVRAADTQAAGEDGPARLSLVGEVVMGRAAGAELGPGQCAAIPTGGMLPHGADAAVMVEDTRRDGNIVHVQQGVDAGANVVPPAADVARDDLLVPAGRTLRPPEIGVLAGVGRVRVPVFVRPVVGIVATGNELAGPETVPAAGQIRDMNSYSLAAAVEADGGVAHVLGPVPDQIDLLRAAIRDAAQRDVVLVSGGSSVGLEDVTAELLHELGPPGVLVHGVRLAPGKPTVLAFLGDRPAVGLPGNPVSALMVYDLFVRPLLRWRMGCQPIIPWRGTVRAELARDVKGPRGREMHLRVALRCKGNDVIAEPVVGVSALLSTMVKADGIVTIPLEREGLAAGETVTVRLWD